eukprot:evm.model.NODE_14820_length_18133_cov_36.737659.2
MSLEEEKENTRAYQISVSCRQTVSVLMEQSMGSGTAFVRGASPMSDTKTRTRARASALSWTRKDGKGMGGRKKEVSVDPSPFSV